MKRQFRTAREGIQSAAAALALSIPLNTWINAAATFRLPSRSLLMVRGTGLSANRET
jgi:hypothetical protein